MTMTFNCPLCGKQLTASEEKAGRDVTCPKCRAIVSVPSDGRSKPHRSEMRGGDHAVGDHEQPQRLADSTWKSVSPPCWQIREARLNPASRAPTTSSVF